MIVEPAVLLMMAEWTIRTSLVLSSSMWFVSKHNQTCLVLFLSPNCSSVWVLVGLLRCRQCFIVGLFIALITTGSLAWSKLSPALTWPLTQSQTGFSSSNPALIKHIDAVFLPSLHCTTEESHSKTPEIHRDSWQNDFGMRFFSSFNNKPFLSTVCRPLVAAVQSSLRKVLTSTKGIFEVNRWS